MLINGLRSLDTKVPFLKDFRYHNHFFEVIEENTMYVYVYVVISIKNYILSTWNACVIYIYILREKERIRI